MEPDTTMLRLEDVAGHSQRILDEVERVIVGKREVLEMVLVTLLADGHILLEDYPGLAKTLMARSFAQVLDLEFARVQFTPDLMPMDVTGSAVPGGLTGDLEFRPGPIFTNLLLADEINRAPPKTQAALLEAMEERQVTIDVATRTLNPPFLVIATQNPIEYEGTYPLPEAQLDRFLTRIAVGYPTPDDEWEVIARRMERRMDDVRLATVVDRATIIAMQRAVEEVHVAEAVGRYMVALVVSTRSHRNVSVGASPRGSLALMKLARARAAVEGRDFVTPDDVKQVAVAALAHRIILRPELWVQDLRPAHVVEECLDEVATPTAPTARPTDP
jgi:MoxR-like ATPase